MCRLDTSYNQRARFRISCQVDWGVDTSVFELEIDTELHETLEHSNLRVGCSLMNTIVSMDVL